MTYKEYRDYLINKLANITENPKFEADELICSFCKITKNQLVLKQSDNLDASVLENLENALSRRLSHEPLQYILGEWEFFSLKIFCGEGCLIPRPETELLCETAIKLLPKNGKILDLCTGSGCISVAVLNTRKDVICTALDISTEALEYAKKNAKLHQITNRINFVHSDIKLYSPDTIFDVIVSNPPYIKSKDMDELQNEVKFEPYIALDGGNDGLDFYKIIAEKYKHHLTPDGYIITEVGYDIYSEVSNVFAQNGFSTEILKDLYGIPRVCIAKMK